MCPSGSKPASVCGTGVCVYLRVSVGHVLAPLGDCSMCVPAPNAGLGDLLFSVLYKHGCLLLRWELVYFSNTPLGLERRELVSE